MGREEERGQLARKRERSLGTATYMGFFSSDMML